MKKNYEIQEISLKGDRKLINACRKAGMELFHPQGPYNGYGYIKLPLSVRIKSEEELQKFDEIKQLVEEERKKKPPQKRKAQIEKYADKLVEECIIDEHESNEIVNLYYENKTTKGTAWKNFKAWYYKEEDEYGELLVDDREIEYIISKMRNASYRHNYTDYDKVDKRGLSKAEVNEVRAYFRKK